MAGGTTANFYANFDQFDQALRQAEAGLKSFELSTRGIQGQLQRMTSSFDGSKLIRDAQLMTSSVEKIGGASKLTEAEQRKVNATVTEAIAKYKALGQDAPEAMQRLARETQQVEQSTKAMGTTLGTALGTFAGFLGAQAITAGVRALGDGFRFVATTAIDMNADLEKTTLQFQTLMGDADKASTHVKSLFEFAQKTPFETGPIIEASKSLQVFGGAALNTKDNLTLIGDAAAATGAPINEVGMWVGRLYANLAAGRPIGEAAQRLTELAVIGPQARIALEDVAKGGASVEDKFKVMQQTLGQFSGAMALQAGTWEGVMSTFRESVQLTIANGLKPLFEAARDALREIMALVDSGAFAGWSVSVGGAVEAVAEKLRAVPRVLATISMGFQQVKLDALELQRSFAELAANLAARLGDTFRLYAQIPGVGQSAYGALAGLAGTQEIKATAEVRRLTADVAAQQKTIAAAQVTLASYLSTTTGVGAAAGQARPTLTSFGDALGAAGDKASAASGKLAAFNREMAAQMGWLAQMPGGQWQLPTGGWNGGGGYLYTSQLTPNPLGGFSAPLFDPRTGASLLDLSRNPLGLPTSGGGFNFGGVGLAGLNAAIPYLSQLVTGGSRGGQIGGSVGGTLGGILGSKDLFGGLSGLGGFAGVLGAAAPFMGPVLGLVGGLIGKLFGPSEGAIRGKEADARIGSTQQQLLQQYGSLENIRAMGSMGQALADAWGSKNVAGEAWFNKVLQAFNDQNAALEQQKGLQAEIASLEQERERIAQSLIPTWAQVSAIIDRYQIAEGSLGQQVNQLGTTANFTQLINDMETLFRAGSDVGGVLFGMREEISKLVVDSIKFGTEIPANMQPYIQELMRAGLLVDANGEKITDLGQIKWGQPIKSEADLAREAMGKITDAIAGLKTKFDELIAKLDEIAQRLRTDLPDAARTPIPTVRIPYRYDQEGGDPDFGGLPGPDTDPRMASGGIVRRRTRAVIGEAGPEAIIPLSRAGAVFGSQPIVVQIELDGRVVAESMVEHLPRRLASRMVGV